ncbi:hypothetical protein COY14_02645 [Candidatus Roizmanbacteria bacterium CG_4_10_14_0_2_um_filter_36_9]|uniref:DAHP synthetase I/KDSA domain-containing protein n=2 Tax=Candidatus Roizmaniibacteriota TaxID=1752723 RepID=A0A2M7U405_9BACT|nr:MAG: hypothetical protein COY14_02645 [Candidatus Roizmanbacteria bacterium CG_4_10_14_0_2_um_filter_36_9]
MKNTSVMIIAGPCSVDEHNLKEIREISQIEVTAMSGKKQQAIAGTRIVGLKSRTELEGSGEGMGIDYDVYRKNSDIIMQGGGIGDMKTLPSAYLAEEISHDTGMIISTEVMNPIIQLPSYEGRLGAGAFMPWNPSVNQLGWHVEQTAQFTKRNGWMIGLKNGKWLGDHLQASDHQDYKGKTTMEKTWSGLVKYIGDHEHDIVLIHRGVDVPGKGDFRNALIHNISKRVKKDKHVKLFFDPSHTYGPKLRSQIVDATTKAMRMKLSDEEFLYDGVLIEVGNSKTDTEQHITISELEGMVKNISKFRDLVAPLSSN